MGSVNCSEHESISANIKDSQMFAHSEVKNSELVYNFINKDIQDRLNNINIQLND